MAAAIADALEVMISMLEVEVRVEATAEVAAVPATVAIDKTVKGTVK